MTAPKIALVVLAILLQAPVSFRLGSVVRDGREYASGSLFVIAGAGVAALICIVFRSPILTVFAACAGTVILAHARFMSAHTAPHPDQTGTSASAPPSHPDLSPLPTIACAPAPADPIRTGMAFLADVMATADRIGELRHRRRMRQAEYRSAMRSVPDDHNRADTRRKAHPPTYIRINPDRLPPR